MGWSPRLRHPVWCAYHGAKEPKHDDGQRPGFTVDRSVPASPKPGDYTKSGYDRGHMVPNHAIISRYGEAARRLTFMMTNIAPQSPALNRGIWREMERRIADLWTARYGEIWVVVGCIPSRDGEKLSGTSVDLPSSFYQLVVAQAVPGPLVDQTVGALGRQRVAIRIGLVDVLLQFLLHMFHDAVVLETCGEIGHVEENDGVLVQVFLKRRVGGNFKVGEKVARVARLVVIGT